VERQVAGLARALAGRGHAVHLFTTTRTPTAIEGVSIHPVDVAMIGEVAAPNLFRVGELRAMLVDARIDVVHAHGMFSTLGIGGLLAAERAGMASVTTHHSLLRHSPTLPAAWLTYRLFSRRATIVSAVSRAAADDARRASGRREIAILPNGFDWQAWQEMVRLQADTGGTRSHHVQPDQDRRQRHPGSVPLQPDRLRITSVMRLARKKSPRDLVHAAADVLSRVRRTVVFTIVGDGPERRSLEEYAGRLGIADRFEFLGACEPGRVADVLAESDMFALPSRREAFGLAILEARAAGLPIVACASGGVPDIVVHGRHGLLASTLREFVDAIVRLCEDDQLRTRIAAASRDGLDAYSWDRVVEQHERVYLDAVSRRVDS